MNPNSIVLFGSKKWCNITLKIAIDTPDQFPIIVLQWLSSAEIHTQYRVLYIIYCIVRQLVLIIIIFSELILLRFLGVDGLCCNVDRLWIGVEGLCSEVWDPRGLCSGPIPIPPPISMGMRRLRWLQNCKNKKKNYQNWKWNILKL